jgi:tripeptide aminopeptidase
MVPGMQDILDDLSGIRKHIEKNRESILANLVMFSEIPAPTFGESLRRDFLLTRFTESSLLNVSTDELDNALGILPGSVGEQNILVSAHLDTIFDGSTDHNVSVQPTRITGAGVGDNSLGVAAIASLPFLLETLKIELKSNLILMGSSRSLGDGDLGGTRFFLDNTKMKIAAGISVEGVKLGRISYTSIGMSRNEVKYAVPEEYDWTRFGAVGSIVTLNELINRILEIPLPKKPRTSIVLGSIRGGSGYTNIAKESVLRFEIRSESAEMVANLTGLIADIASELSSTSGSEVTFRTFAERAPGGLAFSHPLPVQARQILNTLGVTPRISPSTSELSAFIDKNIPAVTIGLTSGEDIGLPTEKIEITPMYSGITQLIGLLLAIDGGYCDGSQ